MTKKTLVAVLVGLAGVLLFLFGWLRWKRHYLFLSPVTPGNFEKERPLEKYSFENLSQRQYQGSEIKLERVLKEEKGFTFWLFSFQSDGKRVTGMANLPKREGKFPVVVMLRGYVDDKVYFTGLGTHKAAAVFAENGFIALAPDFLGFGGSDSPDEDILVARFERPVTVLNLLASIKSLPQADPEKVFLWAHSNGGQIALSVLEVLKDDIPASLWAPVTKGFPGSVLDYIGEMDDQGKKVVDRIFEFEKYYDPKEFSIDTYFDRIKAPLQVQQGGGDYLVKQEWTNEFVKQIESLGKDVTYYTYPGDDHNLKQNWDTAVAKDLEFFRKFLE